MGKELHVGALSTFPLEKIPLSFLLRTNMLGADSDIKEVYAILRDDERNPETVVTMASSAFGFEIKPEQVQVAKHVPDKIDELFAKDFGFKILPVAFIACSKGVDMQAWIGPALVPAEHPLYYKTENDNSVHVVSKKIEDQNIKDFFYYVRLRVKDQPLVLSQVAREFGNANISIKEMRQPQAPEGSEEADMAFLLWPCQTQDLQSSLTAIAGLTDVVVSVNTPLRALSESK